jgi:hypothetical protein
MIGDTEILLLVIFAFFTLIAFIFKDPFLFGIAAFLSVILGIDLGLVYLGDSASWAFGIVGFSLIFFGVWMMIASIEFSLNRRSGSK